MRRQVVLPAPLGPSRPSTSPRSKVRFTPVERRVATEMSAEVGDADEVFHSRETITARGMLAKRYGVRPTDLSLGLRAASHRIAYLGQAPGVSGCHQ